MAETRQELVEDGADRIAAVISRALQETHRIQREAMAEANQIRAEVEQATGHRLIDPAPAPPPGVMDIELGDLLRLAEQCQCVIEADTLLAPYAVDVPYRTTGAVLKTMPADAAALALFFLERSGMFAGGETEVCDG